MIGRTDKALVRKLSIEQFGDGHDIQPQKTLSCQSLPKFNFHTFATIWLPFYLG
jgi:hypothetical protein